MFGIIKPVKINNFIDSDWIFILSFFRIYAFKKTKDAGKENIGDNDSKQ